MNHLLNVALAAIGAIIAIGGGMAATSLIWLNSGRLTPDDLVTGVVCFIVFWILFEVKDFAKRRSAASARKSFSR